MITVLTVNAQNANRSGLFGDLGFGISLGNSPITKAYLQSNSIKVEYGSGAGMIVGFGYRYAIGKFTAIEGKVEYMNTFKEAAATSMLRILPGGRIYFANFKNNKSIFVGANVGVALGSPGCVNSDGVTSPASFLKPMKVGFAADFEIGMSLTPQFGIGLFYNLQSIPQHHVDIHASNSWGLLGVKASYRL